MLPAISKIGGKLAARGFKGIAAASAPLLTPIATSPAGQAMIDGGRFIFVTTVRVGYSKLALLGATVVGLVVGLKARDTMDPPLR